MTTPAESVPDFLTGLGPQQSDIAALWPDPAAFFQQRVLFRARQTASTTSLPAAGTMTTIAYDTIDEDPYGGWSAGSHNWTAPAGFSGWYQATATVITQQAGAAGVALQIQTLAAGSGSGKLVSVIVPVTTVGGAEATWMVYLIGGADAIAIQAAIQNSAGAISTNDSAAGQYSTFELTWVSG
jgi:hypothetical protein